MCPLPLFIPPVVKVLQEKFIELAGPLTPGVDINQVNRRHKANSWVTAF